MRFILIFLVSMIISAPVLADYTLAVFGDSLSNGYNLPEKDSFYAQLEQALRNKGYTVKVLNASKNGETTAGGLNRVEDLLSQKPDAVILELGINDSFKDIPIQTIKENLEKLINTFQDNKIPVLLVGMKTLPNKPANYQQEFEKVYRSLASKYSLDFYPFFMDGIFDSKTAWDLQVQNENLLPNDIHPNSKGVAIMVKRILPSTERFFKKQKIKPARLSNNKSKKKK